MSYAKVLCATLVGVGGHLVEVEAYLAPGLPAVIMTGLPDSALYESRERVRAAIVNSGESWPSQRISVNLLPAYIRKYGSGFDLAIALAVLCGTGELPPAPLRQVLVLGELGLDGSVLPVRGVLPMVAGAAQQGVRKVIAPVPNSAEAALVPGTQVLAAGSLAEVVAFARGLRSLAAPPPPPPGQARADAALPDLVDVAGQHLGRFAMEVAAAGGHHVALFGAPGGGKTMLAQRLPSLLPDLDDDAAIEVTSLHSVAGRLAPGASLLRRPPIQAPHHTASISALVGGGSGLARPGSLSLAHRGVLMLDEAPEFSRRALDALRQPLEEGIITLGRTQGVVVYPASVQLVLTANPCPCSRSGDECECAPIARRRYLRRLSGPLLDRIDIQLELFPLGAADLMAELSSRESSEVVAKRVAGAREAAAVRWAELGQHTNASIPARVLRERRWRLPDHDTTRLRRRLDSGAISARGHDRVLRLAWTIADLMGHERPGAAEVDMALDLRSRAEAGTAWMKPS